jgi:pantoate--beta-alanine ligase
MADQLQVINTPQEMRALSAAARQGGRRVGFVPTMGALHAGHLSLLDYARPLCDFLVVSIFVNPLQFDRADDLDHYPRTWEADRRLCAEHGADVIYAPTPGSMYPEGFLTKVSVAKMTEGLCGAHRPGHFDGVTTVVLKLFNAVQPHLAAFGQKDYQQLTVIGRMARDLDLDVEVVGRPTVREADGLAMSSRNVRLSPSERAKALCLWRGMSKARALADAGGREVAALAAAAAAEIAAVPEARLEYLEIVDAENLEPLAALATLDRPARICLAVWLGETRLIDNLALN